MQLSTPPNPDHLAFATAVDRAVSSPQTSHVWSPYSVASVLALLATGACERTLEELLLLLGPHPEDQLDVLDTAATPEEGLDLAALNGLYLRKDLQVRPEFTERVRARVGAEISRVDFAGDPEGVRTAINRRVSEVTRGIIDELLPPGTVHPDVRMALVNALWVKMLWTDPFVPDQTRNTRFHSPGGTHKVPTMHKVEELPYSRARGWSMVSLAGEYGLTMDVLLPDKSTSTPPTPTAEDLTRLYRGRRSSRVSLALPRFSVETDTGLLPFLASLGVRDLGTADARFDGISDTPLKVDTLVHQSVLRVNEKGAEGAAATAAIMVMSAVVRPEPVRFVVDRPFVFVLRRHGAILFLGRITDPVDPGPAD